MPIIRDKSFFTRSLSVLVLAVLITLGIQNRSGPAPAQAQEVPGAAQANTTPQAKEISGKVLLDPKDTVVLLLDHQTGLFQTVKDVPVAELRGNAVVLAKIAELAKRR